MSVFEEIMCKVDEVTCRYVDALNGDLKVAFEALDAFAEEYKRGKREPARKNKALSTLQSINEDEASSDAPKEDQEAPTEKRLSQKRGKQDVDGMSSPEQEKRHKRNASVKAQNNISKQVNVSLTQKLRRDDSNEKSSRRRKGDKENTEPLIVKVKEEKISLPPEPMEVEAALDIPIKQEPNKDDIAMPPPAVPLPRSRRQQKDKSTDSEDEQPGKRRTRTRKQTDTAPPAVTAERAVRSSRRGSRATEPAAPEPPAPEPPAPRPKRTRAKKKISESSADNEVSSTTAENIVGSPAEKPRPKRTRRGQKAAEKEESKPKEPAPEPVVSPKEERVSNDQSPAIPQKTVKKTKNDTTSDDSIETTTKSNKSKTKAKAQEPLASEETALEQQIDSKAKNNKKSLEAVNMEETRVISQMNTTVTISMDKTVDLPNGVYDHTDGNQANVMNATVVLEKMSRETLVLDKAQTAMDATVVLEKDAALVNGTPDITDDNSLITEDSDPPEYGTPPQAGPPEPTSAVKAKVQQFEELATRTTRTKTRALAKMNAESENCTPPDKIIQKQQVLSAETLAKMNNLIFNGKAAQGSVSAVKPSAKLPPVKNMPASASKISAINKAREEMEARGKDDARRKKEAMLEAKKEQQRRKREEKMAAAAAAREHAERERRAALQAAAKDRLEKQAHADQGKLVRLKEVEKKKQELARKVAETEERRRAEEAARQARLAEEQRRADAARRKQQEESEAMKKEAALMAKEIEKRQKEYLEKQKIKQRVEADKYHTPMKGTFNLPPMEPVYMSDGFQYLNSDEDEYEDDDVRKARPKMPAPAWGAPKARHHQLALQHLLPTETVDRLFSVRVHSPDLRAIFPALGRREIKRTSSAVWRTPPPLPPA